MSANYTTDKTYWFPRYGHLTKLEIASLIKSDNLFRLGIEQQIEVRKVINAWNASNENPTHSNVEQTQTVSFENVENKSSDLKQSDTAYFQNPNSSVEQAQTVSVEQAQTVSFENKGDSNQNPKKPNARHNRNRDHTKERNLKSTATATAARSSLKNIAFNSDPICNIDLLPTTTTTSTRHTINAEIFKQAFFPNKHNQDYGRLNPFIKVLLAQYIIHKGQDRNLVPHPFVFRLPKHLHSTNGKVLNKKIQRKLSSALKREVQFWIFKEYDPICLHNPEKHITHINGEILINLNELQKLKEAFKQLAGATITANPSLPYAIRFPLGNRRRQSRQHGKFYSIFNWCSYSTKQLIDRSMHDNREWLDCKLQHKPIPAKSTESFLYITGDLLKKSKTFYKNEIK